MSARRILALILAALLLFGAVSALAVDPETDAEPGTEATETAETDAETPGSQEDPADAAPTDGEPSEADPADGLAGDPAEEDPLEASQPAETEPYPDLEPGTWYYEPVRALADRGVLCARADGRLDPMALMSNYDLIHLLNDALGNDVDDSDWRTARENHLAAAEASGLLKAEDYTYSLLAQPVNRYEMAQMLSAALTDVLGEKAPTPLCPELTLQDMAEDPADKQEAVAVCCAAGILQGSGGKYRGWRYLTRVEGMTAVLRLIDRSRRNYVVDRLPADALISQGDLVVLVNRVLGLSVSDGDYRDRFEKHFAAAEKAGWLKEEDGLSLKTVAQPVERCKLAVFTARVMARRGEEVKKAGSFGLKFVGVERVPEEYRAEMESCLGYGVMDSANEPWDHAWDEVTWGEVCEVLRRALYPKTRILPADGFVKELGSFTTPFAYTAVNSAYNCCLASDTISGSVIQPGARLSFLGVVGDPIGSRGYKLSGVYAGGKLVEDYGGGICQAASTMYAASVYSGLDFVIHYNHGFQSVYIRPGLDSTVFYPFMDLEVQNPYPFPVKMVADTSDPAGVTYKIMAPADAEKPEIRVEIVQTGSLKYLLTRYKDGKEDYSFESTYYGTSGG